MGNGHKRKTVHKSAQNCAALGVFQRPLNRWSRDTKLSHSVWNRRILPSLKQSVIEVVGNLSSGGTTSSGTLDVRFFQRCTPYLDVLTFWVCFPAFFCFLAASAPHSGQCFTLTARGLTWRVRAAVGITLGEGDIPTHAPCHGLAVAHGWHLVVAACPAVGICDVVAVLVSIDDRCVCQALSCRRKR